jgi:tryptophan-rich sensory protein
MTVLDDLLPVRIDPQTRRRLADVAIAAAPLAVGSLSGLAAAPGIRSWYRTLDRPSWNPPDGIFGPVWTGLYGLMGVSLVRIVRASEPSAAAARRVALGLFATQLALNGAWSWIFFSRHAIRLALADILVLWLAIAATIGAFGAVRPGAAALLLPYLAWVTFATVLTAAIWRRNR